MLTGQYIVDVCSKNESIFGDYQLIAGTAWLFSDVGMDQSLDFLFVDKAGQVALANLVGMATSARNIVLLGDQMQLGQPIQGVHPGRSGESSLEYLLNGKETVSPEHGIFLKTTWRMHPDVCRFISDAVYDSRLEPEPQNGRQVLRGIGIESLLYIYDIRINFRMLILVYPLSYSFADPGTHILEVPYHLKYFSRSQYLLFRTAQTLYVLLIEGC